MMGELLLDHFRIDAPCERDRTGSTWRGTDTRTGRAVAIKLGGEVSPYSRLLLEAEALASLHHPGLVDLVDFGLHHGCPCLVMEWVTGEPLAAWLERAGHMFWPEAFEIGAQVLEALTAMHDQDLAHCDVTPSTIILAPGPEPRARLIGLRFATMISRDAHQLGGNTPPDKDPRYMAPEQLVGAAPHPGTDLYALGLVLWRAISGAMPFDDGRPDLQRRRSFRPAFHALPPGAPPLPRAARLALGPMLRASLWSRCRDGREASRRLRAALEVAREQLPPSARIRVAG